jgi:hypothetical protein
LNLNSSFPVALVASPKPNPGTGRIGGNPCLRRGRLKGICKRLRQLGRTNAVIPGLTRNPEKHLKIPDAGSSPA